MSARAGVTLLELIVVIALLAVIASVSGLAFARPRGTREPDPVQAAERAARDSALRSGRAVTLSVMVSGAPAFLTALPDGRIIADAVLGLDPLTGRSAHASR